MTASHPWLDWFADLFRFVSFRAASFHPAPPRRTSCTRTSADVARWWPSGRTISTPSRDLSATTQYPLLTSNSCRSRPATRYCSCCSCCPMSIALSLLESSFCFVSKVVAAHGYSSRIHWWQCAKRTCQTKRAKIGSGWGVSISAEHRRIALASSRVMKYAFYLNVSHDFRSAAASGRFLCLSVFLHVRNRHYIRFNSYLL